jgi:hypothetical protein
MNNFDKRCHQLLNELNLGSLAKGALTSTAKGVGKFAKEVVKQAPGAVVNAVNAAQNPSEGIQKVISGIKGKFEERKENKKLPFSRKNPPKKDQIVQIEDDIYGIKPNRVIYDKNGQPIQNNYKFQTYKKVPNSVIIGQITQKMDMSNGEYGVGLRDQIGPNKFDKSRKLVFAKTKDANYWQVYDRADISNPAYASFILDVRDPISPNGTGIMVGALRTDVSKPLRLWTDFKQFLDQKIGEKKS